VCLVTPGHLLGGYDKSDILLNHEPGPGLNAAVDELVLAWPVVQTVKDGSFGLKCGRNRVDMNAAYSN